MGHEVDEQVEDLPRKISGFCSCGGHLFLRIVLRHLLAQEALADARTDLFQRTHF